MTKQYSELNNYLREKLQDPELALAYLNAALVDEDQRIFLLALKRVLEAQGDDMSAVAQEASLNRQNLYRMLSDKGNPRWDNLKSLVNSLGWEVQLAPKK